jgi:rRNA biogenesis protein RRP5
MVTLKISSKKIKSIFKKFLNFETSHGSADQQEAVKEKARDYVNSLM